MSISGINENNAATDVFKKLNPAKDAKFKEKAFAGMNMSIFGFKNNKNDIPIAATDAVDDVVNNVADVDNVNNDVDVDELANLNEITPKKLSCEGKVEEIYDGDKAGSFMLKSDSELDFSVNPESKKLLTLNKPVKFKITFVTEDDEKKEYNIDIKKGYSWDGASIPKSLQWIVGSNTEPKFIAASLLHDVLCENKELIDGNRALSSAIFKEMLIQNGVNGLWASMMAKSVDMYQKNKSDWHITCGADVPMLA